MSRFKSCPFSIKAKRFSLKSVWALRVEAFKRTLSLVSRGQTHFSRRALSIRNYKRPREKGLEQFTVCAGTDTFDVSIRSKAKQPCRVKKQMVINTNGL